MSNALLVAFVLVLGLLALALGPLLTIWVLNTLFGLGIAYTGWTWLASLVFTTVFAPKSLITAKIKA